MVLPGIVTNVTAFGAFVDIGISCPSTHPIVPSLHGRTASVHLGLRSALQGEDLASLKQGAGLGKGL